MQALILGALIVLLSAAGTAGREGLREKRSTRSMDSTPCVVRGKEVPGKSAFSVTRGNSSTSSPVPKPRTPSSKIQPEMRSSSAGCARGWARPGRNPADYLVHEGKIYVFGSDECHKRFQAIPRNTGRACRSHPSVASAAALGHGLIVQAVTAIGGATRLDAVTRLSRRSRRCRNCRATCATRDEDDPGYPTGSVRSGQWRLWASRWGRRQLSPEGMWFVGGAGQAYPMPAFGRPSLEQEFGRHPIALFRARRNPAFKAVALGTAQVGGVKVDLVRIISGAIDITLALDGGSGRIRAASFRDRNNEGEYGTFSISCRTSGRLKACSCHSRSGRPSTGSRMDRSR